MDKASTDRREEAQQIRQGLRDPMVRAFVRVVGILEQLPSDRARMRVLRYVADELDEASADER